MMWWLGVLVVSYLLGSIPFSYLIVRLLKGIDIRTVGSGNTGATNVLRAAGKGAAVLALVLDMGKGVAAVALARAIGGETALVAAAGVAVVLGHVFPVFLAFRGGKGVATAAGALGTLGLPAALLALVAFVGVVTWKRYVSLGSVVAAVSFPLLVPLCSFLGWIPADEMPWLVAASAAIGLLVVSRHASNLQRLRAGMEPKLGQGSAGRTEAERSA